MLLEKERQRFFSHIEKQPNGCWYWTAAKCSCGYGRVAIKRLWPNSVGAHRVAYMQFIGEIPEGMCVCHTCDTPCCVNPEHLFLGTHQENMDDMVRKGRSRRGSFDHRGNNHAGKTITIDGIQYPSFSAAGRAFGVTCNAIRKRIKLGWAGYDDGGDTMRRA